MKNSLLYIYENMWVLIVLITPLIVFVWYKTKFTNLSDLIKPFFFIGLILTALGIFLNNITFSTEKTIQSLLLKDIEVAGKFIPIGYCFILMALLSFIDTLFDKIFKTNKSNET